MELDIGVTHSDLSLAEADSWFSSDTSSGYLEDAIAGWGIWCNHNNLPSYSQNQKMMDHYLVDEEDLFPTFCSSTTPQILHGNFHKESKEFSNRNLPSSSPASLQNEPAQRSLSPRESDANNASASNSKGHWKKIAYPFELVKAGGVEGETTLKDINNQMLMSPSKPIPHPVANLSSTHPYACISARSGYGISGKVVTALTRIHTQGRGSITIIRTKG
ncbi:hypothetical protein HN51_037457 [Arachis hypogaea]|uniref:Protein XRI1 n=1 Tax=Arachis hypogaea TaxID=3818 RepID=A0A444ZVR2_ARAHY|nr:uncharacterized protein LOC107631419 [Arachis ipaensis]XP_025638622.1 uncharacterized protein LOC112733758 [Arachis hypogaea]QHO03005.1 hypothetical protein DS421_13g428640 [Arachis hypogaea]RYR18321.1 hypothetical protein Ahy_B03g062937 [Arachis hypogaea]